MLPAPAVDLGVDGVMVQFYTDIHFSDAPAVAGALVSLHDEQLSRCINSDGSGLERRFSKNVEGVE